MNLSEQQRTDLINAGWAPPTSGKLIIGAELISEIEAYLNCAAVSSMSRNNSEQLAAELLERIREP